MLRLTEALGLSSSEFLARYTKVLRGKKPILPLVVMKMREDEEGKPCPLVDRDGCRVYGSRPWSCRMFPLDQVSRNQFQLVAQSDFCKGLTQERTLPVLDYLHEQEVDKSALMDAAYQEITNHPRMDQIEVNNPKVAEMVYLACYDLDRFKDFVFETSFLDKFDLEPERLERIEKNKVELLKLAFDWVKFGLFAEKTLKLKSPPAAAGGEVEK